MRRGYGYSRFSSPRMTLNKMAATISKKKKSVEKSNARKGIYRENIVDYMNRYVVITTFNNCLVCMRYANKSYFGRAACDMLEAQLKYANGMGADSNQMSVKMEIAKITDIENLYESRMPTADPQEIIYIPIDIPNSGAWVESDEDAPEENGHQYEYNYR